MTFLNIALLAGAAALAIPIIIHLLSRRRFTPIPWGAMFLIDQVVRQNRRRLRLEQWILLAIRCAIPVVLALLMARPVITGWRALAGDEPVSAVIIVDASYSMSAPAASGGTGHEAARSAVESILSSLPPESQATLLVAGGGTRAIELERAGSASLPEYRVDLGPADAPAAIAAARRILEDAPHRRREIVLLSDFQALNWPDAAISSASGEEAETATDLTFVQVPTASVDNLVVEDLSISPPMVGPRRPARIRAVVRNAGDQDLRNIAVRLVIDGVPRDESRLNLARGAISEANFITRFETPGHHTVEIAVDGDALPADNILRMAVHVPQSLPVLLVGPQTDLPFPQNPTDFLALALDPASASQQLDLASLLRPEVITAADLNGRALAEARVVFMANVPELTDAQLLLLRDFVRNGGAMIVFPGDRTNVAHHNSHDLYPARITALRGQAGPTRVIEPPYAHPALVPWNDPGNGRLGEARISRWYALDPRPGADSLVTLETGEPFIVEHALGRGTVLMVAGSAAADWSDLPLRAAFLPLVQQLAGYAVSRGEAPAAGRAGEALVVGVSAEEAGDLVMLAPDGTRQPVSTLLERGQTLARFPATATAEPGFYRLVSPESPDEPLAVFAVNAPREESQLDRLEQAELEAMAGSLGASVATGGEGYAQLDHDRRFGREAWHWAWGAVLALLFGELLLQGWFGRRGLGRPTQS